MLSEKALTELVKRIEAGCKEKETFTAAIDGRCASGKTSLAEKLSEIIDCNVIHTDDFYLQKNQRTEKRLSEPGGNLDRERLLKEVLIPLREGREVSYRPFVCSCMDFGEEVTLPRKKLWIIEGSYSCHPDLREHYDLTVFVTTDKETQKKRILSRNGEEKLQAFLSRWIPLEERYFEKLDILGKADITIKT